MSLHRLMLIVAAMAGIGAGAFGAIAQADEAVNLNKARPLTSEELYNIYNSRSWLWNTGAGHFSVKERRFTAWSNGSSPSYAVGQWFITNPGKLCFRATWHSADGSAPALTCFSHREAADGIIYQKREPDGEWALFRSAPARRSDEWAKLRHGDHVASRLNRIEARLGAR